MKQSKLYMTIVHALLILWTVICVLPVIMIVIVSFTDEQTFVTEGFKFIPKVFSLAAWKVVFSSGGAMLRAIFLTVGVAVVQPLMCQVLAMMIAYPMSRPDFVLKKPLTWFYMLPMFISGGMLSSYILITRWLHLGDTIWVYLIPGVGLWGIILYRNCFKQVPASLIEAATIDGATEMQVLWKIVLPMSRSIFVIQYFMGAIGSWNDYGASLMYVSEPKLWKIQYLIFRMLKNQEAEKQALGITGLDTDVFPPDKTLNYAMCVVAIVPIICIFPFVQKYFAKGIAAGSIKE